MVCPEYFSFSLVGKPAAESLKAGQWRYDDGGSDPGIRTTWLGRLEV